MNTIGCYTLFKKEVLRFWKVGFQTLSAPILTALLYQLIFAHVMQGRPDILPGVSYNVFLIPGLAMMSMLQNAFANSSSSLIQSRITGNLIFILLPPLGTIAFFCAYVGASILRHATSYRLDHNICTARMCHYGYVWLTCRHCCRKI